MAMQVLLTTDTELSSALHDQGVSAADNYARSIEGRCRRGRSWGVPYQLEQLRHWGLKTVFFVDPMPALVYGPQIIADIVAPCARTGTRCSCISIPNGWTIWRTARSAIEAGATWRTFRWTIRRGCWRWGATF